MWILPKQLHTSAFVPDMEALSLDLSESSQLGNGVVPATAEKAFKTLVKKFIQ